MIQELASESAQPITPAPPPSRRPRKRPLRHFSDEIRLDMLEGALKEQPREKEEVDWDEVACADFQTQVFHYDDGSVGFFEVWSDDCFEALFEKRGYKRLGYEEALEKFLRERMPKIAAHAGLQIVWTEADLDIGMDSYLMTVVMAPPGKEAME